MAYRRFGSGPALLFIHGWPLRGITYRELIATLQEHYTCWVPDLPGAGDTPWPSSMKEAFVGYTDLLEKFVDAVGLASFGLVAHDSGGTVARMLAARLPDHVWGLALTNTEVAGHPLPLLPALQTVAKMPGAAWMFSRLLRSRRFVHSKYGFRGVFADRSLLDGDFDETILAPLRNDTRGAMQLLANVDLDLVHTLPKYEAQCRAPLLAIWGDRDPFFPLQGARETVERWPAEATLEVLEGLKLLVHEEAHREVSQMMRSFFDRVAPRSSAAPISA